MNENKRKRSRGGKRNERERRTYFEETEKKLLLRVRFVLTNSLTNSEFDQWRVVEASVSLPRMNAVR